MANTASAKKRARQQAEQRKHNASLRSALRTVIKKVVSALKLEDAALAKTAYAAAVPVIDRMASKNIIHKNKAARHKSRLAKHIASLSSEESK